MDAYSLWKHEGTGELHLFKGTMSPPGSDHKCSTAAWSICKSMAKSDKAGFKFTCATEREARTHCAAIGRTVCGTCVSALYSSYT